MKRVILGIFLATGSLCEGVAADAGRPRLTDTFDWTGAFIGAHFGYSAGSSRFSSSGLGTPPMAGSFGLFGAFDPFKGTGSYAIGLSAGYNYMLPSRMVLGVEPTCPFRTRYRAPVPSPPRRRRVTLRSRKRFLLLDRYARALAMRRVPGCSMPRAAWRGPTNGRRGVEGEPHDLTRLGLAWGAGAEFGLSPNWSARFEYLGTGFGSQGVTFSGGAQRVSSDWAVHAARLGFNYRFGRDDRKVLDEGLKPLETDWFSLRAQTTYLQQYAAPFRAPYRGTNSLIPNQTRETWDVTFYAGIRPWQGGEF